MLALAFSVLIAVYLLGPDLISRWILGFAVPRKALVQTKAEEITRAILWAAAPLLVALMWAVASGALARTARWGDLHVVFSGLYSTTLFDRTEQTWYVSLHALAWWNFCVLWRLYFLVLTFSFLLNGIIYYYGPLRRRLPFTWMTTLLATLVLPRVAEWHVLLSPMLLPSRDLQLHADVLTRSGSLYQGRVADKVLTPDGSIQSLTLTDPKRFRREEHKTDETAKSLKPKEHYWQSITGNVFVVLGGDISNINLRYQRPGSGLAFQQFLSALLKEQTDRTTPVRDASQSEATRDVAT